MFTICYLVLTVVIIATIPTSKIIVRDFISELKEIYK